MSASADSIKLYFRDLSGTRFSDALLKRSLSAQFHINISNGFSIRTSIKDRISDIASSTAAEAKASHPSFIARSLKTEILQLSIADTIAQHIINIVRTTN